MRKIMLLAAMLALVAVVAVVPALASDNEFDFDNFDDDEKIEFFNDFFGDDDFFEDFFNDNDNDGVDDDNDDDGGNGNLEISQEIGQEAVSGDVELSNEVSNSGDNSNVCAPALQFANTGNLQNAQGFVQYGSETGDIEFGGSSFVFEPTLAAECEQSIDQSAVAYGW